MGGSKALRLAFFLEASALLALAFFLEGRLLAFFLAAAVAAAGGCAVFQMLGDDDVG